MTLVGFAGQGPAKRAGLREGDVIRSAAGMEIADLADFYRSVWALGAPGVEAPLTLERNGRVFEVSVPTVNRRDLLKARRLN